MLTLTTETSPAGTRMKQEESPRIHLISSGEAIKAQDEIKAAIQQLQN